jgi:hypothetical protein
VSPKLELRQIKDLPEVSQSLSAELAVASTALCFCYHRMGTGQLTVT